MSRSGSSARWLTEHFNDTYVKQAQQGGYRSRAAFKLFEIQEKDHILRPGMTVIDLGASPGGWSIVAKQLVGEKGRVFALDVLPMEHLPGVEFILGDFTAETVETHLRLCVDNHPVDLVMSDMAPNISGITSIDQPRSMYLAELTLGFAQQVLRSAGNLVVKTFQGEGFDHFLKCMRSNFLHVKIRKPKASRARSNEIYLVGLGFKANLTNRLN